MDRLIAINSVPSTSADTAPVTGTPQFATSGNPATSTPATVLPAYAFNAIQEELIAIIAAAGIANDRTNNAQVLAAIRALIKQSSVLTDTGAVNAYAAVNPTPLTSGTLLHGVRQTVQFSAANTSASTYAPDGLTAKPIYGRALVALQGGEIALNGIGNLVYIINAAVNGGAGAWILMECTGGALQIASGVQSSQAAQAGQVQGAAYTTLIDSGAVNAYVAAFTPALAAPVAGAPFWVKIKTANTGASTLNATGAAYPLIGAAHAALQGGELIPNAWALIVWNATLSSYVLLECTGGALQTAAAVQSGQAVNLGQTTALITASGLHFTNAAGIGIAAPATLASTALNGWVQFQNSSAIATMPPLSSAQEGQTMTFLGGNTGGTLKGNGAELIQSATGINANTLAVAPGESVKLVCNLTEWYVANSGFGSASFGAAMGSSGWMATPSPGGLIIEQWGVTTITAANTLQTVSMPIAWNSGPSHVTASSSSINSAAGAVISGGNVQIFANNVGAAVSWRVKGI